MAVIAVLTAAPGPDSVNAGGCYHDTECDSLIFNKGKPVFLLQLRPLKPQGLNIKE